MGVTRYLAGKSALARVHLPAVREELEPLMMRALVGICGVTELEMLYSARNIQERARMKEQLEAALDRVDTPQDIWEQAAEIQEALTEQAQHRPVSIPDGSAAYVSGDTVYYDGLREIGCRFAVDTASLFLGDAHFPQTGGTAFTMNSRQGAQLADALSARCVVPVHYDSFDHLAEPPDAIGRAFAQAGLSDRLSWLRPGRREPLAWPRPAEPGQDRQEAG